MQRNKKPFGYRVILYGNSQMSCLRLYSSNYTCKLNKNRYTSSKNTTDNVSFKIYRISVKTELNLCIVYQTTNKNAKKVWSKDLVY